MTRQRLAFAALLIAVCSVVADSGTAEARHCRRCGSRGYRGGYTYAQPVYNTQPATIAPTTAPQPATAPQAPPATAPTPNT